MILLLMRSLIMLRNELYKPWVVEDKWGVEIIDGEFSGVVVQINGVEFSKTIDSGLDVDYTVVSWPEILDESFKGAESFVKTFELIINDVLREAVELEKYEQDRSNDSQEFTE
jgi:hypothetical protein